MKPKLPAGVAVKELERLLGVAPRDEVFFHLGDEPCAGRVLGVGKHGITVHHEGRRRKVRWESVLGHKRRAQPGMTVVDVGEDGAIMKGADRKHVFVRGYKVDPAGERADGPEGEEVRKSMPAVLLFGEAEIFAKAIKNRPGLSLQDVTDKAGRRSKRWKKTAQESPAADREKRGSGEGYGTHNIEVGDSVSFKMGELAGEGTVVAAGRDGATVEDASGREHRVHWREIAGHKPKGGAERPKAAPQVLGEQKPIAVDKFKAAEYAKSHDKADVTPEEILAGFPEDTASKIKAVQERLGEAEETIGLHKRGGEYTPDRMELHQEIIGKFLSPERIEAATPPEGEAPTFVILGGRGGSGKSWFEGQVYEPENAIVLDADAIKGMLPEYEGWNAHQVHEESGELFDLINDLALELGLNIVHDATMKTAGKAVAIVKRFKEAGYRTEAHYMHLPRQEAAKRAVSRFLGKTQRYVPVEVVLSNTGNEASFDQVRTLVDHWSFRDNNVPQGQEPILISEGGEALKKS